MREQLTLAGTAPIAPLMAKAEPFLRWAGGKRWILPLIAEGIHRYLTNTGGVYFEPFLGGGAVALHLGWPRAQLSDAVGGLTALYCCVRDNPAAVHTTVAGLVERHGMKEAGYLAVRGWCPMGSFQAAARFLYLNQLCFNGLYRENQRGVFNVPFGKPEKKTFPVTLADLQQAADALEHATIRCKPFDVTIADAKRGDFVYADPPYHDGFVAYTAKGFSVVDQENLAEALKAASTRGAAFVANNSDTPLIRELYGPWATCIPTAEARAINSDTEGRQRKGCLIITNQQKILGT